MKKIFTLATLAVLSLSAMAEKTTWKGYSSSKSEVSTDAFDGTSTASYITVTPIACGQGITGTAVQGTYKPGGQAADANTVSGIPGYPVKFVPTNAQVTVDGKATTEEIYTTIAGAVQYDQIVKCHFAVAEGNTEDYINISNIKFKATRIGTDAVLVNVRVIGENDEGEYEGEWLINADNATTVAEAECGAWQEGTEGVKTGYMPSREDSSKGNSKNCFTQFNIPVSIEGLYDATVEIAVYGISNNKGAAVFDVEVEHSTTTGVAGVKDAEEAAPAVIKTVDGIIKNGVKYNYAGQIVK